MMPFLMVAAGVAAFVAAYAQRRISDFTAGSAKAALTRTLLLVVGLAVGYLGVSAYPDDRSAGLLAFVVGFGAVHVPAALILFLKGQRRAGRS
jgi:hypothetical protein